MCPYKPVFCRRQDTSPYKSFTARRKLQGKYLEAINNAEKFYGAAAFYTDLNPEDIKRSDLIIPAHNPGGLDVFDLYILLDVDQISEVHLDMSASRIMD